MPTFDSEGVEIAYIDELPAGGATRALPILLIHGFASNIGMNWISPGWVKTLTEAGYRVIALDNRGHGESEKLHDKGLYGGALMAEDARRLLDHLEIEKAHVMGYSMGARITAFLTLNHPDRVKTATFGGLGINMVRGMAGTGPIAHALEADSIDDVANPTARTFRAFAEQTKSDLKALAACIRSSRDPISRDDVGRIACPVLVAVGSEDVVGGSAKDLAELIPSGQSLVIEGREHMKAVGDQRYKDRVLQFLEQNA
ncbi:MAG: alpha/beta hydrolase [Alphaproteobacteria bacterium]|nr:alpha/beta hydrolase [Alphaproteobacteria bacterium]